MSDEKAREIVGTCSCDTAYTGRKLIDPNCAWHQFGEEISSALRAARNEALEEAAKVIDDHDEGVIQATSRRVLTRRTDGNTSGLGYAAAIRALKDKP